MINAYEARRLTSERQGFDIESWWVKNKNKLSEWIKEEALNGESCIVLNEGNCQRIGFDMENYHYIFKVKEELSKLNYRIDTSKYNFFNEIKIGW